MTVGTSGHIKKVVWTGSGLALVAAAAWTLRPQPVPATMGLVARGPLASTVSAEGRTRVRDFYVVAAPVDGELQRITLQPGETVNAGDPVATITPAASRPLDPRARGEASAAAAAAKAAVARAEAGREEARVGLEHARSQYETAQTLSQSGAGTRSEVTHRGHDMEMRQRALEAASAAAIQARGELARAQAVLGYTSGHGQTTSVQAPVSGRVLRVLHESSGTVASGTPLLELGDVNDLQVDAEFLSTDAAQVHRGARATVTGWGGVQPLQARVRRIDPAAFTKVSALGLEEQRVHVLLDLVGPPPPSLGHKYRVDVSVVVWESADALRAPSTALFRQGRDWAVYVVRGGRARLVTVDIGASDGTWTVIEHGLNAGEEVVTQPSDLLHEGVRVARIEK